TSVEKSISFYDVGGTLKKTVTKNFGGIVSPIVACEFVTLDNGAVAGSFYGYSNGQQLSDKKEYDFGQFTSASVCSSGGPVPPPPTPFRETVTSYQSFAATPIYPTAPSIFDRPSSVITYGNGTRVAETDYAYDQSSIGAVSNLPAGTHDETNYAASSTA